MKSVILLIFLLIMAFLPSSFGRSVNKDTSLHPFTKDNKLWGYINNKGKIIVSPKLSVALPFNEKVGICEIKGKSCLVYSDGNIRVLQEVQIISDSFSEGLAVARKKKIWGFIDKKGDWKLSLSIKFDENFAGYPVHPFSDGLSAVVMTNGIGFINKLGQIVIPPRFHATNGFHNGVASVLVNDKWGLIDKKGNFIVNPQNNYILDASDGLLCIQGENNKWKYINIHGENVFEVNYSYAGSFSQGLAVFEFGNRWGFLDKKGNQIIPPKYEELKTFSEGLAMVKLNGKYGFIDKNESEVIPIHFDYVYSSFKGGLAYVRKENLEGYINKKGQWIWNKSISVSK